MNETLKQQEDKIIHKLNIIISDTELLLNDDYWRCLKEHYTGLLEASILILNKIKEENDWI